jgi:hypothetical protein
MSAFTHIFDAPSPRRRLMYDSTLVIKSGVVIDTRLVEGGEQ